jgi:6-phosphogluconolactonase (cycloisomerase 2 family)
MHALVGNWREKNGKNGFSIFTYDPRTAQMDFVCQAHTEVCVGSQYVDYERSIIYATDEICDLRGQLGGGGYIFAYAFNKISGEMKLIGSSKTLLNNPSYVWLDRSKEYAIISHHSSSKYVTKLKKGDGDYYSITQFDDTALVLMRINNEGSPVGVVDAFVTPGDGLSGPHAISHHHSVMADPSCELYIVCDKGLDTLYSIKIDREKGRLIKCGEIKTPVNYDPRYIVFHPTLPVFYGNNEKNETVYVYSYDVSSGRMKILSESASLMENRTDKRIMPSDLAILPDGRFLYAAVRGINIIAVFEIDHRGIIKLVQNIDCGGDNPRGLCIAPDSHYLFSANLDSRKVTVFGIAGDGLLSKTGQEIDVPAPGSMKII